MLTDDGTVLAELDMRLTHDQFFNMYEQPVYDRYLFCHFFILTYAMFAIYCNRVIVTVVLQTSSDAVHIEQSANLRSAGNQNQMSGS